MAKAISLDVDPFVSLIKQAIPIAEMLAKITTTKWDDNAIVLLKTIVESDSLIALIKLIVGDNDVQMLSGDSRTAAIERRLGLGASDAAKADAAAAGISWLALIQYIPQIVTFILTLLGNRR